MRRIVVIGGGITGLAAAHRIVERSAASENPCEVVLMEAGPQAGGIVQTSERDGFLIERGPDSFLSEKPAAVELAKRLGLDSHLIETNENYRRSFIVREGRLLPVPAGFNLLAPSRLWPLIASDIFSWRGKARIALDLVLPRAKENGADESLAHFVRRRLGREALERMAQPMVGGIYTADPETLSLRATVPRFLEMEREHRSLILALRKARGAGSNEATAEGERAAKKKDTETSGARYSLFLSFDRGMQLLTDTLAKRISDSGARIQLNTRVKSLEREVAITPGGPSRWRIQTENGEIVVADGVCLALPSFVAAGLLQGLDHQLASELDDISYASSATINLAYKRQDIPHPLNGFGFVVPFIEKRTVMACTFSSVKFAGRAPDDCALLRAFVGGALQPEVTELTEAELLARVRSDLRDLLGIEQPPLFTELSKWHRSMPQYHVGHLDKVRRIEERVASLPGLALAGNAYSGLGIPDCIRSGESAGESLQSTV